jgi:hypothetical protein
MVTILLPASFEPVSYSSGIFVRRICTTGSEAIEALATQSVIFCPSLEALKSSIGPNFWSNQQKAKQQQQQRSLTTTANGATVSTATVVICPSTTQTFRVQQATMATANTLIQPRENDVLCGKTRECLVHKGSAEFRYLIESYCERYKKAEDKYSKMALTREIYHRVSQKARFLRYRQKDGTWEELSPAVARDKVS